MPPKKVKRHKRTKKTHGRHKTIDEGVLPNFDVKLNDLPYTSEKFTMGSVQWQISLRRKMIPNKDNNSENNAGDAKPKKETDYVAITLENLTKGDKWETKMKGKFSLIKNDKKAKDQQYAKEFKCIFHKCNTKKEIGMFFPFHEVSKNTNYAQDNTIHLELKFAITTCKVEKHPHYDFKQPTDFSDGKVRVEGRIFYVNKKYLAMHSAYFDSMFFGDFMEKDAEIVELKGVHCKLFEEFLQVIYPSRKKIEQKRVQDFLDLGDRYQVPILTALCEEFLLSKECHLTPQVRLRLSDKFKLIRLQTTLLRKMDDDTSVQKAKGISDLSKELKAAIDRKAVSIKDVRKKAKNEQADRMDVN